MDRDAVMPIGWEEGGGRRKRVENILDSRREEWKGREEEGWGGVHRGNHGEDCRVEGSVRGG